MEALILIKGMFDVCVMVHQSRLVAMANLTSERPENMFLLFSLAVILSSLFSSLYG